MSRRKFEMYEYCAIIYRLREGLSARQIAKEKLASRRKVNEILALAKAQGWLDPNRAPPGQSD